MFGFVKNIFKDSRGSELRMILTDCLYKLNELKKSNDISENMCLLSIGKAYTSMISEYPHFPNISDEVIGKISIRLVQDALKLQSTEGSRGIGLMFLNLYILSRTLPGEDALYVYQTTSSFLKEGLDVCHKSNEIELFLKSSIASNYIDVSARLASIVTDIVPLYDDLDDIYYGVYLSYASENQMQRMLFNIRLANMYLAVKTVNKIYDKSEGLHEIVNETFKSFIKPMQQVRIKLSDYIVLPEEMAEFNSVIINKHNERPNDYANTNLYAIAYILYNYRRTDYDRFFETPRGDAPPEGVMAVNVWRQFFGTHLFMLTAEAQPLLTKHFYNFQLKAFEFVTQAKKDTVSMY